MDELQGYAKPVLDQTDYENAMQRLRAARDNTQAALKQLEDQLAPVLTPVPENATYDPQIGEVAPPQALIVAQIMDEARWIEEIGTQISRIRGRLAV